MGLNPAIWRDSLAFVALSTYWKEGNNSTEIEAARHGSLASIVVSWSEQELFGALGDGIGEMQTPPMVPFQRSRRSELYTEEKMDFMLLKIAWILEWD